MKTRFKTILKLKNQTIIENTNFLNNQNYIKDKKSKLFYNNYHIHSFLLYFSIAIIYSTLIWLLFIYILFILSKTSVFFNILFLIFIYIIMYLFIKKSLKNLLSIFKYYIYYKKINIAYKIPYILLKNISEKIDWEYFIITKK